MARPLTATPPAWRRALHSAISGFLFASLVAPAAFAAPEGGTVIRGKARIQRRGHTTRIRVRNGTILDWDSFNVAPGERVHFVQRNRRSRVLNRVLTGGASQIDGTIRARGQVYIVNPAGIFFGGRAVVDVGRLVAAAGNLSAEDFASGHDRIRSVRGVVENAGRIEAERVALIGQRVANHGQILSEDGSILLVAGDEVWLGRHDSHVLVQLGAAVSSVAGDAAAVANDGLIDSGSGRVRLAAGDAMGLSIRNRGEIRAREILLTGGAGGLVDVSGSLDASNSVDGTRGGEIAILGDWVALRGAEIDASGDEAGGTVIVGGDGTGAGAAGTFVSANSRVSADARLRGDGGRVIVFAEGGTRSLGRLSARGGVEGGDGGFIETSGLRAFEIGRAADVGASAGQAGTWLIDPLNIEIVAAGGILDTADGATPLNPGDPAIFQSDSDDSSVSADIIAEALAQGSDVIITTDRFLGEGGSEGNIDVNAAILVDQATFDSSATLSLRAANDISVNQSIQSTTENLDLNIELIANNNPLMPAVTSGVRVDGGTPVPVQEELGQSAGPDDENEAFEHGDVTLASGARIDTNGGILTIQGVSINLDGAITTEGGSVRVFGANPRTGGTPLRTDAASAWGINVAGSIDTSLTTTQDGLGSVLLEAGGTLNVTGAISTDTGGVVLNGTEINLADTIQTRGGGVQIGREESVAGAATLPATVEARLETGGSIATNGGSVFLRAETLSLKHSVTTTGGDISGSGNNISVLASLDAGTGDIDLSADQNVDIGDAITAARLSGNEISLRSALDLADSGLTGSLRLHSSQLFAERISLTAGDGFVQGTVADPVNAASIDASAAFFGNADGSGAPALLSLTQDANLSETALPDPANFSGALLGMEYELESAEGSVSLLGGAAKVADTDLLLIGQDLPDIQVDIRPQDLEIRAASGITVDTALAAHLLPTRGLTLHAGSDGTGDLDFGAGVLLAADEISLRAGDGNANSARVDAVTNTPDFRATVGSAAPLAFSLRQDAEIADANIPAATQLEPGGDLTNVVYSLRSDGGQINVETASKLANTKLSLLANNGISIANPITLASADLGGIGSFVVTQDLLTPISLTSGSKRMVLRAAAGGSGTLSFNTTSGPIVVRGDEIRLVARDGVIGTGDGSITVGSGTAAPLFQSASNAATPPNSFVFEQDSAVSENALPGAELFQGGALPSTYAVRSDEAAISLTSLDLVPTGGKLILDATSVDIGRNDGTDLDFSVAPGDVEIRADQISLVALNPDPAPDPVPSPIIDASSNLALSGFDDQIEELEILASSPASSPSSLSFRQEGSVHSDQLPAASSFENTPASVAYSIATVRGGIVIDDRAKVEGSDLSLTVELLDAEEDPIPGRTVSFGSRAPGAAEPFQLNSLSVSTPEGLAVDAGTHVIATDTIRLAAGAAGEGGNLSFGADVRLDSRSITLLAGNGPAAATGEGVAPSDIDARTNSPIFNLASSDPTQSTFLGIEQEASVQAAMLPTASQLPQQIDLYVIQSDEGSVEIQGLENLNAKDVSVLTTEVTNLGSPSITVRPTSGNLDFTAAAQFVPFDSLRLFSPSIELEARDPNAWVNANSSRLSLSGVFTGSLPSSLAIRQDATLSDAARLPELGQFVNSPLGVAYSLESLGGDLVFDTAAAAKTAGTRLELIAQGTARIEAPDLSLGSLRVESATGIELGQAGGTGTVTIDSIEAQTYAGAVTLNEHADLRGSDISMEQSVDGARELRVEASGSVHFGGDVGVGDPLERFEVSFVETGASQASVEFGNVGSDSSFQLESSGDILFNPAGRTRAPERATIFKRDGTLSFHTTGGDFKMGGGEKLSVNGTLEIGVDAPTGTASLGDLSARDRIAVDATNIEIVRRAPGASLSSDGALVRDSGVNWASNQMDLVFDSLEVTGAGADPVLAVPDPLFPPAFFDQAPAGRHFAVAAVHGDRSPLQSSDFSFGGLALDIQPEGPSRADLSRAFGESIAPPQVGAPDDRVPSDAAALREVGIHVRSLRAAEHLARLDGVAVYDDSDGSGVVERRLHADEAQRALELYRRLFGPDRANAPQIRQVLESALTRYRDTTLARRIVGFEFRRFVKNRPASMFEAYQALEDLDALFRAHRNSGLTTGEYREIQHRWLADIAPESISVDELSEAIHPSRYVRGSDILDIFGK